ncbi:RTA1-like protein [Mycena floridula]|nr:RTA1-like protein [Mycena floridula]
MFERTVKFLPTPFTLLSMLNTTVTHLSSLVVIGKHDPYGYKPSLAICGMFIALFSISSILHLVEALAFRSFFMLPTAVFAGLLEILGWSARLWSSLNTTSKIPFSIQITATIVGPTPLLAANFIVLGRMIQILGPAYSRISPQLYTKIFLTCDIVSLIVQGAGGGSASAAANHGTNVKPANNVVIAGIAFQLAVILAFVTLALEFTWRFINNKPFKRVTQGPDTRRGYSVPQLKNLACALTMSTLVLVIRAIYRLVELSAGWGGKIMSTQWLFNVFDGGMVVIAIFAFNFAPPGKLLRLPAKYTDTILLQSASV